MMNEIGCADCGGLAEGGICLKACKSCMLVKYCNANCQRNHWPKHKKECKLRAAEIRDEALFKDPPPKKDCQICFLPMPVRLVSCISLPPATIVSVPITGWQFRLQHNITPVVERIFVEGVYTPSVSLETLESVHFVKQIEWAKQMKKKLKN
jgi:hypothetical protein